MVFRCEISTRHIASRNACATGSCVVLHGVQWQHLSGNNRARCVNRSAYEKAWERESGHIVARTESEKESKADLALEERLQVGTARSSEYTQMSSELLPCPMREEQCSARSSICDPLLCNCFESRLVGNDAFERSSNCRPPIAWQLRRLVASSELQYGSPLSLLRFRLCLSLCV